ncbi:MAG TPA: efflux RND transporter periplasmic adaptor subunit [candidate division Zixibacteria bacterium]|nr:efflux RND transporter periplasmic adaptor subunit [candidate division Zixibacteria bacterium]
MKKVIGLTIIVAVIGILIVLIIINQNNELAPDPPGIVTATGTIEITEIDISPQLSGKILELNKVRGEKADSLELLAKIDAKELRARLDEIDSRFKMINAQIKQAEIQLENLNRNLQRTEKALDAGAATQSQYDELETQRDYTRQQIETLKTQITNLDAQKEVLQTQISNSELSAPVPGWITSKNMEEGELAMPGVPIYTLSLLEDAYINVYVNETRIGEINLNDSAYVTIDTYPDRNFKGYVEFISPEAEFTPKNIQTKEERVKLVFEVRINLNNPEHILKPGLPADVKIFTE